MSLKIFSEKKSLIAGRKVIFYIIAGVAMSIAFLILAWIIPVSQSEIAIIPVGLEDYVLSQRFFSSSSCFVLQDKETDRTSQYVIDLEKFNQANINKCYDAQSTDVKAYRLTLDYKKTATDKTVLQTKTPLLFDHKPTCETICANKGKVCMVAIDNGKPKECDQGNIRFEGRDDFCVCGERSQNVGYNPPRDERRLCKDICEKEGGGQTCVMAIDDGNKIKKCDAENVIFKKNGYDDYCFCGGNSVWVAPGEQSGKKNCYSICAREGLECIMGKDDYDDGNQNDNKHCYKDDFGFESKPDDYCICGPSSEKIVPLPFPGDDPTCSQVCGEMLCIQGVQDGEEKSSPSCSKDIEFDQQDDYCKCSSTFDPTAPTYRRTISTKNWQGALKKAEVFQVFVNDSGAIQKAELLIEVQDAQ